MVAGSREEGIRRLDNGLVEGPQLTEREVQCLSWTARGKSCWELARILTISENTVNFHLKNAVRKLDAANKCHAAALAVSLGIVDV